MRAHGGLAVDAGHATLSQDGKATDTTLDRGRVVTEFEPIEVRIDDLEAEVAGVA